jgi:prepilin-type N-terminal cleavage/methylation domain-containing protein
MLGSWRQNGFSIIELLVVLAIIGVVVGIGVFNGLRVLQGQQERAAVRSIQQSIWQGATAASARGVETELVRNDRQLLVREVVSGRTLRREELPAGVSTNLPAGQVLRFTPPGRVAIATLRALPEPLVVEASGRRYQLRVSLIGEVQAQVMP